MKLTETVSVRAQFQKFLPLLTLLSIFPLWELGCALLSVPDFVLPKPSVIWTAFVDVETQRWLIHLWATLRVALLGFLLSIVISIPLAIVMVRSAFLTKTLFPVLVVVQSTPVVAIAPLIIVIMGTGEAPRLVITCLITFFPLVVSTTTGMMSTPPELLELSRSLRGGAIREIWQIRLPFAVPHIFSGLKVGITLAIIGAVIAEFVAAEEGLGYFVQFSTSYFKIPQAFAALFFLSIVSLVLFKCVTWIQTLCFPWSLPKDEKR
ncbi:TauT family ABC transporter permease [Oleiphilus messinensis]|uniref:TauT family ABC transporter permease n=1 Tax=Oleiphilus messinensis TaxID=141451 RepID=A0A1Y0I9J7_9GAMM|nr:ABC transporter permease [Oleiphilus messinensis]ARU56436.1 TauT family ABC transporter permease [Oleiphilus messinensis]